MRSMRQSRGLRGVAPIQGQGQIADMCVEGGASMMPCHCALLLSLAALAGATESFRPAGTWRPRTSPRPRLALFRPSNTGHCTWALHCWLALHTCISWPSFSVSGKTVHVVLSQRKTLFRRIAICLAVSATGQIYSLIFKFTVSRHVSSKAISELLIAWWEDDAGVTSFRRQSSQKLNVYHCPWPWTRGDATRRSPPI
jgi:hypothetical protein